MIEDMTHLGVFDAYQREILSTISQYNSRASGVTDKSTLIDIYLAQNDALREVLRKQNRALRWMRGEAVEPEHHEVEAVIIGVGGLEY